MTVNTTYLDALLNKLIEIGGTLFPKRTYLNFIGSSVQAVDNPGNDSTDITIGGGGWSTVLDIDFSTLANQTLNTDGPVTVGGQTWTKQNSASSTCSIVNGSGLSFQPGSSTDYNGSTRSLPMLILPLSTFVPSFDLGMSVRLWAYIQGYNGAANYDSAVMSIDTSNREWGWVTKRGNGVNAVGISHFAQRNHNNQGFFDNSLFIGAGNNVLMTQVAGLVPPRLAQGFYGSYSAGWPAQSALSLTTEWTTDAGLGDSTSAITPTNLAIGLGAQRAGSITALNVTFGRVRVDVKP